MTHFGRFPPKNACLDRGKLGQQVHLQRLKGSNFRQLIDLGCLFIWYFHYMPVGSDTSPEQAAAAAKKK